MNIEIFDNIIEQDIADQILDIFFGKKVFWWWDPSTLGFIDFDLDHKKFYETPQFVHPVVDENKFDSPYSDLLLYVSNKIFNNKGIKVLYYKRVKVNLLLSREDATEKSHPPHVDDIGKNCFSIVYYVDDSDGPTIFYDNNQNIIKTVEPKKNRAVFFPSNLLHSSSCPKQYNRRLVVNYVVSTDQTHT